MKKLIFNIKRHWRFFWQRRIRGFDDSELWSLDITCAKFMAPRLKAFINHPSGTPGNLTEGEWTEILKKIYNALQIIAISDTMIQLEQQAEVNEGLALFGQWFQALWN